MIIRIFPYHTAEPQEDEKMRRIDKGKYFGQKPLFLPIPQFWKILISSQFFHHWISDQTQLIYTVNHLNRLFWYLIKYFPYSLFSICPKLSWSFLNQHFSPWLKKIINFVPWKCLKSSVLWPILRHGWIKYWISCLWNSLIQVDFDHF